MTRQTLPPTIGQGSQKGRGIAEVQVIREQELLVFKDGQAFVDHGVILIGCM